MSANYKKTIIACHFGYFVQAAVNNLLPLLFVFFNEEYNIPLFLISILITYNFALQIITDSTASKIVLKFGHRKTQIFSLFLVAVGFVILAITPFIFKHYLSIYFGIMLSVTFTAVGGGITELILTPVIEALPMDNKSSRLSMLHSFYCVGHILVILLATAFFAVFKIENWPYFALFLLVIPIGNIIMFAKCPIISPKGDEKPVKVKNLFSNKIFLFLFIIMITAGAGECAIGQWISYFAEVGLNTNKSLGDLIGTCSFAVFMLLSRWYFGFSKKKKNLLNSLLICGVCLTLCYVLSVVCKIQFISLVFLALGGVFVGIMWPGAYAVGGEIFPKGGTTMFAMLALGGDIGCTIGPAIVGWVSDLSNIKIGMVVSSIFPIILIISVIFIKKYLKNNLQKIEETKS